MRTPQSAFCGCFPSARRPTSRRTSWGDLLASVARSGDQERRHEAIRRGEHVGVSAITLLEIVLLGEGGKPIGAGVNDLLNQLDTNPIFKIVPLTSDIAQEVAARYENQQIEPIHLLAALVTQTDGVVPPLLARLGIHTGALTQEIDRQIARLPMCC